MNKVISMQEIHRKQPFRRMGTMRFKGKTLFIGQQNFDNNSVPIKEGINGAVLNCPMGNEDGDVFFLYNGKRMYLRYVE